MKPNISPMLLGVNGGAFASPLPQQSSYLLRVSSLLEESFPKSRRPSLATPQKSGAWLSLQICPNRPTASADWLSLAIR